MESTVELSKPIVHCPYCKDGLAEPRDVVACARCGARHHDECFTDLARCASCGSSELLAHRELARRVLVRRKVRAGTLLLGTIGLCAASAFFAHVLTRDWNEQRLPQAILEARARLETDEARLADERGALAREKEQLHDEHAAWLDDRARVLKDTAIAREEDRQLARQGWKVAELIANDDLDAAIKLVPAGPGVLRDALEERLGRRR